MGQLQVLSHLLNTAPVPPAPPCNPAHWPMMLMATIISLREGVLHISYLSHTADTAGVHGLK